MRKRPCEKGRFFVERAGKGSDSIVRNGRGMVTMWSRKWRLNTCQLRVNFLVSKTTLEEEADGGRG